MKVIVHIADVVNISAVEKTAKESGSRDVIIANAGYLPKPDFIENGDADKWWKGFEVWLSSSAC